MVDTSDIIGRHEWSGQWFLKVDEEYQQPIEWGEIVMISGSTTLTKGKHGNLIISNEH